MAILGLKDYPYWYDNIKDRMPLMFGFNFPTFKIVDVLSVSFSTGLIHGGTRLKISGNTVHRFHYVVTRQMMVQSLTSELSDKMRKHNDDWRWSVYASRKIAERIRISLQFASDNMSKTAWSPPPPTYSKYTEIMTSKRQWYWVSRIQFYL